MFMLSFVFVILFGFLEWKQMCAGFFYRLFIHVSEIQLSRGEDWDPINWFNTTTFLCLYQVIDPAIVLFMFMLSFVFVIVCGFLEWKRICAGFFIVYLYMYFGMLQCMRTVSHFVVICGNTIGGCLCRDCMVVGLPTTCAISAYHH